MSHYDKTPVAKVYPALPSFPKSLQSIYFISDQTTNLVPYLWFDRRCSKAGRNAIHRINR